MEWFTSPKKTANNTNDNTSTTSTTSTSSTTSTLPIVDSGKTSAAAMRKLTSQISVQKAEKAMADAKSDYERRLKVLTHCMFRLFRNISLRSQAGLEEKAEENVTLAESNRELHQKFVQLDQKLKHLVEENTNGEKDNSSKNRERSNKEIEKKLEMMAEVRDSGEVNMVFIWFDQFTSVYCCSFICLLCDLYLLLHSFIDSEYFGFRQYKPAVAERRLRDEQEISQRRCEVEGDGAEDACGKGKERQGQGGGVHCRTQEGSPASLAD
jgi:hypothetical protein